MTSNKETRLAELRLEETDGKMILEGYAIVFEQETLIGDEERGFKEIISKDAVDEKGLKVRAELLDTTTNADVYKMVRAGLLDKMSFAFTVKKQSWDRKSTVPVRRIEKIDRLFDVSVVDLPAYEGTSIYSRSLELVETELKALEDVENKEKAEIIKKKIHIKTII